MRRACSFVVTLVGLVASATGACNEDRAALVPPPALVGEAGTSDAAPCPFQCSLDGRSVTRSCTGEIMETCPDHLACGAAKCQEPCAAAAADRSSNGCDFYFASPRFTKSLPQSCHATFVVNSSNQPATLSLEYGGKALDMTRAVYRVVPNSTDLSTLR